MKTRRPTSYDLETWNALNPVGSPCIWTDDRGQEHSTRTCSKAWKLGHGESVVLIEGRTGCESLDRIKMLETHKSP